MKLEFPKITVDVALHSDTYILVMAIQYNRNSAVSEGETQAEGVRK
jgi:hypothetical protein